MNVQVAKTGYIHRIWPYIYIYINFPAKIIVNITVIIYTICIYLHLRYTFTVYIYMYMVLANPTRGYAGGQGRKRSKAARTPPQAAAGTEAGEWSNLGSEWCHLSWRCCRYSCKRTKGLLCRAVFLVGFGRGGRRSKCPEM
jgi:hypothetical protein